MAYIFVYVIFFVVPLHAKLHYPFPRIGFPYKGTPSASKIAETKNDRFVYAPELGAKVQKNFDICKKICTLHADLIEIVRKVTAEEGFY